MSAKRAMRVPPRLVHDHGLGPPPGPRQAVQILVVMERVAAAPVDEAHVGERDALPVVVDLPAGLEQEVGDARDRRSHGDGVLSLPAAP